MLLTTGLTKFRALYSHVPLLIVFMLVALSAGEASAQSTVTIHLSPVATYLRTNEDPNSAGAVPIDLGAYGFKEGDTIELRQLGAFVYYKGCPDCVPPFPPTPDEATAMIGVFSASGSLLPSDQSLRVPDAIAVSGLSTTTGATLYGGYPTDIPQDFRVTTSTVVKIPAGAKYLFVAADDSFYGDNADPNGDLAVQLVPVSTGPAITGVTRQYPGVFLEMHEDVDLTNRFDITVDWKGKAPGAVKFSVNGKPPVSGTLTAAGATHAFDMDADFTPSFSPSVITITATDGEGNDSLRKTEEIRVYPYPAWLKAERLHDPTGFKMTVGDGVVTFGFEGELPDPHWAGEGSPKIIIPSWVPYLGGVFGLTETYLKFDGSITTAGAGALNAKGQTGFTALGLSLKAEVSGSAKVFMNGSTPFTLQNGKFSFKLIGTLEKEVGLIDALPGSAIVKLASNKFIGPYLHSINKAAKLKGELSPSIAFNADWAQDGAGNLSFTPKTTQLGFDLKGTLQVEISDHFNVKSWVAGGGSLEAGTSGGDLLKKAEGTLQVGAEYKLDSLFDLTGQISGNWTWKWDPLTGTTVKTDVVLSSSGLADGGPNLAGPLPAGAVTLIEPDYQKFGEYSAFNFAAPGKDALAGEAGAASAAQPSTLVANVFRGASPALTPAGGGRLLLWAHQRTDLPVPQSTDIAWSYNDGGGWSAPAYIAQDTQAELAPAAARDAGGKIVAVWTRIKEPNFSTPITTTDDLPLFYTKLEVVSSVFNPATRLWGSVTQLTDNTAFDTELRLSSDTAGNLLLTWLSNPTGEFLSTPASLSSLMYSRWDGASWSAPAAVDTGLVGVSSHAAAVNGSKAFVVVPHDPNPTAANDGVLKLYKWNGSAWGASSLFASGGVENRLPSAVYDGAGEGHVVWQRANNLVHATLTNPTPLVVRNGSASLSFYGAHLVSNPQGNLTLLRQEAVNNGPAALFAQIYDTKSKTWSLDRQVQSDTRMSSNASGYYGTDGLLRLAYLSTVILRRTRSVTIEGEPATMTNIPEDGQTDLRLLDYSLTSDLAVEAANLTLTPELPAAGRSAIAKLDVRNVGDFGANNFQVGLYAGNPDAGGALIGSVRVTAPLVAGDHRVISIPFVNRIGGDLFAVVDDFDEFTESNEANNRAKLHLPLQTYTVGGKVSVGASGVAGVTVTLTSPTPAGFAPRTANTSGTGSYSFAGLPAGRSYVVTPSNSNYTFTPASLSFANLDASKPAANFAAAPKLFNVSGKVSRAGSTIGLDQVTVTISSTTAGFTPRTALTNGTGAYTFTGVPAGRSYVIKAARVNYTIIPAGQTLTKLSGNKTGVNFAATLKLYSIGGSVKLGTAGLGGVTLTLTSTTPGFAPRTVLSGAGSGVYNFTNVPVGRSYVVTPAASALYSFTPSSKSITNLSANQAGQNFAAARKLYNITGKVSKSGTTTGVSGVTMTLKNSAGAVIKTVTTQAGGVYSITGVPAGVSYVLRPTRTGMTFTPVSKSFANLSANQAAQNFSGT